MRKMLLGLSVLAMALIAGSGMGFAYPTLQGPTGGAVLPDAMVAPAGTLSVAADWTKINTSSLEGTGLSVYVDEVQIAQAVGAYENQDITIIPVRLQYGAGSGAELWGAWTHLDNSDNASGFGVGAKYQIMREPKDSVNLAVGVGWNSFRDIDQLVGASLPDDKLSFWNIYAVATKDMTPKGKEGWMWEGKGTKILGSLGVIYQKFEDILGVESLVSDDKFFEPFVSVEFVGGQGTSLGVEYRFKDSSIDDKGLFSAVLRHPFTKNLTAQVGITNGAFAGIGGGDFDVFGGLMYSFGMGRSAEY